MASESSPKVAADVVDVEQHPLVDQEEVSAGASAAVAAAEGGRWRFGKVGQILAAGAFLAGVPAAVHLASRSFGGQQPVAAAAGGVGSGVVGLAAPQCGALAQNGVIITDANTFKTKADMDSHGFVFKHNGECKSDHFGFPVNMAAGHQRKIPSDAFHAWCWPGDLIVQLTLKGSGYVTLTAGDDNSASDGGSVALSVGNKVVTVPKGVLHQRHSFQFSEGDILTIHEYGNAIIAVEKIEFTCGAQADPAPVGPAPVAQWGRPTYRNSNGGFVPSSTYFLYANDDKFVNTNPNDWDCNLCIGDDVFTDRSVHDLHGVAGVVSVASVGARKWCADACDGKGEECKGILYRVNGEGHCMLITNGGEKSCKNTGKSVCALPSQDQINWDYLKLVDNKPRPAGKGYYGGGYAS